MMKKMLLSLVFLLAANKGYAEYIWPVADYPQQISVAGAKQLSDDAKVSLEGFITGHLRGDHYLFRDDSGEIGIEIEGDVWKGVRIGPDTRVIICGEIEHESGSVYIDVDRLKVTEPGRLP